MKHSRVITLALLLLVMAFGFMACGSGSEHAAKELAELLNRPELPFQISAKEKVSAKEGAGHLVRFEDAHIRINPEFIKIVNPQAAKKMPLESLKELHCTAEAVVFYYEKKKVLEIRKISGFSLKIDDALMKKLANEELKGSIQIDFAVEEMEAQGYDLSPFLNTKLKSTGELFAAMILSSAKQTFNTRGVSIGFSGNEGAANSKKGFQGKASIAEIRVNQDLNGQIMQNMYGDSSQIKAELFETALKENQGLLDIRFSLNALSVEGVGVDEGETKHQFDMVAKKIDLSYKIAPNEEKSAFKLSTSGLVDGFSLNITNKPEIGKIARIEKMATEFDYSPITPGLAVIYMQFMHNAMNLDQSNEEGKKKFEEQMGQQGMAAMGELMQAKPTIHFKLAPLIHPWATVEGQADMSMMGMAPVGKVLLSVTNASSLVETIARELAMDKSKLSDLADLISKYLIVGEDGTGKMTLEMDAARPGQPIINGK